MIALDEEKVSRKCPKDLDQHYSVEVVTVIHAQTSLRRRMFLGCR